MAHDGIHAAFRIAGTHIYNGIAAHVKGSTHLSQAPTFTDFEQHLGSRPCASTLVAHVDEGLQAGAVGFAEHDLVARWADDRGFTRYFG